MSENPINILLVEDNPQDVELLSGKLSSSTQLTYNLTTALRLEQACHILKEQSFNIILLDLSLPDSFRLDTFKILHATSPNLPIIVLTDHDNEDVAMETISQGAQDYLIKGDIHSHNLTRAIIHALERHKLTRRLKEVINDLQELKGLLPMCPHCKRIRNDEGYWSQVESYISQNLDTNFSSSHCPECPDGIGSRN